MAYNYEHISLVYHSLDWNTGSSYFCFGQVSVFIYVKKPTFFNIDKCVATMDDLVVMTVVYCSVFSNA